MRTIKCLLLSSFVGLGLQAAAAGEPGSIIPAAERSIIRDIHRAVIIPGEAHPDLWNVPVCVTVPGDPITFYLRVNVADRLGKDQSFGRHQFISTDGLRTLTPIDDRGEAFRRAFLPLKSDLPDFPQAIGHTSYSPHILLDATTAIKVFTFVTQGGQNAVTSARCRLEHNTLIALERGNAHTIPASKRGLYEPQVVRWHHRFYMTGRAEDQRGYHLSSDDGLTWSDPQPWTWDDGTEVPMDQTMTKLLSHPGGLVLVYTRIRDDNAKTFRHRAPLHVADLDPTTLRLRRDTERVIVPDKGMAVGNFWAWPVSSSETVVVTAEWPRDNRPTNGDIWCCTIRWRQPNTDYTADGHEIIPAP